MSAEKNYECDGSIKKLH